MSILNMISKGVNLNGATLKATVMFMKLRCSVSSILPKISKMNFGRVESKVNRSMVSKKRGASHDIATYESIS